MTTQPEYFVPVKREALEQAVDWFQCYKDNSMSRNNSEQLANEVSTALRAALEQTGPESARHAFDSFAAQYDTHGSKWQDMGADEYFIAGYNAGLAAATQPAQQTEADKLLRQALEALDAELSPDWDCNSYHPKLHAAHAAIRKHLGEMK